MYFTTDAGDDIQITTGTSIVGGGGGGGGGGSTAADDISAGDAAINLTTTSGNITIDAQGDNTDIIFKGTDDSVDITALTLDMSEAGAATFNSTINKRGYISGSVTPATSNNSDDQSSAFSLPSKSVITSVDFIVSSSLQFTSNPGNTQIVRYNLWQDNDTNKKLYTEGGMTDERPFVQNNGDIAEGIHKEGPIPQSNTYYINNTSSALNYTFSIEHDISSSGAGFFDGGTAKVFISYITYN